MTAATAQDMNNLIKGYGGILHGDTKDGSWDIEFPDAINAMSFAQTVEGLAELPMPDLWVTLLCVKIREGDSITDIHKPVVLTVQ